MKFWLKTAFRFSMIQNNKRSTESTQKEKVYKVTPNKRKLYRYILLMNLGPGHKKLAYSQSSHWLDTATISSPGADSAVGDFFVRDLGILM